MKILTLLFSVFVNFYSSFNYHYQEKDEIIIDYGSYRVVEKDNLRNLFFQNQLLESENTVIESHYFFDEKNLTIISWNRQTAIVTMKIYNLVGYKTFEKNLNNEIVSGFDVIKKDDSYYCVGGVSTYQDPLIVRDYESKQFLKNINTIIMIVDENFKINKVEILGGKLDEFFYDITIDNYIYVSGKKDTLSGGTFGNGGGENGGYMAVCFDYYLNIINYQIFIDEIIEIATNDNFICLVTNKELFRFNLDFNDYVSLKFAQQCLFANLGRNNKVAVFSNTTLEIYDILSMDILNSYLLGISYGTIEFIGDVFYLKYSYLLYELIIYEESSFQNYIIYDYSGLDVNNELQGWNDSYQLQEVKSDREFNPLIFGEYKFFFDYGFIKKEAIVKIEKRVNVQEGGIYAVGYRLVFSGIGYLDNQLIYNNHQLTSEGKKQLRLIGNDGHEEIISFNVDQAQLLFYEDDLKNWEYEINQGENLHVELNIQNDISITKIIVNHQEYNYIWENQKLIIIFNETVPGIYSKLINRIYYEYSGLEYYYDINHLITYKVLETNYQVNSMIEETNSYINIDSQLIDKYNLARYFKIVVSCAEEYQFNLAFKTQKVNLDFFYPLSQATIYCYLMVDVGGKELVSCLLFELYVDKIQNNFDLGELVIEQKDYSLSMYSWHLNKKNIQQLKYNNQIYYQKVNQNNMIFLYGFIMMFVLLLSAYFYKKRFIDLKKRAS